MAPSKQARAAVQESVETQQEMTSSELPMNAAVTGETVEIPTNQITPGGQKITARIGFIDVNRNVGAGRAVDKRFESLRRAVEARLAVTGVQPATILNFLPIPLVVNSPMQDLKIRIPPAPEKSEKSDAFSFYVWHEASIQVLDAGEGIKQPWEYVPVQLAQAFLDEYNDYGGVVLLRGIPTKENLSRPEVLAEIARAKEGMVRWMMHMVEEGNSHWNTANRTGAMNIVEVHRRCAIYLKDLGVIDTLPEWIVESRSLTDVASRCPKCRTQPNHGSLMCLACGEVFDPEKAFIDGLIDETHGSLERLTRKQVEALNISAYVAETSDERPERLKSGMPKPLSLSAAIAVSSERPAAEQPVAQP